MDLLLSEWELGLAGGFLRQDVNEEKAQRLDVGVKKVIK